MRLGVDEALRWYRNAAAQGYDRAKEHVLEAEGELCKQQQATAPPAAAERPSPLPLSPSLTTCANSSVAEAAGCVALKPFSRCKAVVYCAEKCQAQHWKVGGHRGVCK